MPEELIKRSEAIRLTDEVTKDTTCPIHIAAGIEQVLTQAPAADAVVPVRCKDCRFWDNGRCEGIENGLIREYTSPDDFCSYGERRDNNACTD